MPLITKLRLAGLLFSICFSSTISMAQDLTPRAYVITPIHSNAVILTFSFFNGSILFNPTLPISDVTSNPKIQIASFYHALNFLGRSANIVAALPYGVGNFQGKALGMQGEIYRSGLGPQGLREMATEASHRRQSHGHSSHRPIRSRTASQPGQQPMGFQARTGFVEALGPLGPRCLRGSVVLHHQPCVFLEQPILSRNQHSQAKAHRFC